MLIYCPRIDPARSLVLDASWKCNLSGFLCDAQELFAMDVWSICGCLVFMTFRMRFAVEYLAQRLSFALPILSRSVLCFLFFQSFSTILSYQCSKMNWVELFNPFENKCFCTNKLLCHRDIQDKILGKKFK